MVTIGQLDISDAMSIRDGRTFLNYCISYQDIFAVVILSDWFFCKCLKCIEITKSHPGVKYLIVVFMLYNVYLNCNVFFTHSFVPNFLLVCFFIHLFCECWCLWSCFGFIFVSLVGFSCLNYFDWRFKFEHIYFFSLKKKAIAFLTLPFSCMILFNIVAILENYQMSNLLFPGISVCYNLMRFSFSSQVSLNVSSCTCWPTYRGNIQCYKPHNACHSIFIILEGLTLDNEANIDFDLRSQSFCIYTYIGPTHKQTHAFK